MSDQPNPLVVHWRSKATGETGHGQPLPAEIAWANVTRLNKIWPDFHHWTEPAE